MHDSEIYAISCTFLKSNNLEKISTMLCYASRPFLTQNLTFLLPKISKLLQIKFHQVMDTSTVFDQINSNKIQTWTSLSPPQTTLLRSTHIFSFVNWIKVKMPNLTYACMDLHLHHLSTKSFWSTTKPSPWHIQCPHVPLVYLRATVAPLSTCAWRKKRECLMPNLVKI
jgi:hypothetical protein